MVCLACVDRLSRTSEVGFWMGRIDSYLICATPRTGSTLLCGLMASTKVAGQPESYFRQPDEQLWAERWDIVRSSDRIFEYSEFIRAALAAGRSENGVFAARIMWGTLDYLFDRLGTVYPAPAGHDIELLNQALGHTGFIYLQRDDVLAQAVSWHRAEQSSVWHQTDREKLKQPVIKPRFDFDLIHKLVQVIEDHNSSWRAWFASAGIQPHMVRYEDLDADPVKVVCEILDFLGLKLPPGRQISTHNRRLADELNAEWIDRYRAGIKERIDTSSESGHDKYA
ncbi:MAG: hypothetical protein F4X08_08510 [Gemmatimonadetes bacterium]|nr:hypothetical protein [Gemmatimonadota bacterium]MYD25842.1 hypothetical protein [Gemmatimonadota bacterium]MYI98396.1 hypothetical protein [Gemmatimonadota bacterium]